jgi:hypothetical protein
MGKGKKKKKEKEFFFWVFIFCKMFLPDYFYLLLIKFLMKTRRQEVIYTYPSFKGSA